MTIQIKQSGSLVDVAALEFKTTPAGFGAIMQGDEQVQFWPTGPPQLRFVRTLIGAFTGTNAALTPGHIMYNSIYALDSDFNIVTHAAWTGGGSMGSAGDYALSVGGGYAEAVDDTLTLQTLQPLNNSKANVSSGTFKNDAVFGGGNPAGGQVEGYDGVTLAHYDIGTLSKTRFGAVTVNLDNEYFIFAGGNAANGNAVDVFDTSFAQIVLTLPIGRTGLAGVPIGTEYAAFGGGQDTSSTRRTEIDILNKQLVWETPLNLSVGRTRVRGAGTNGVGAFFGGTTTGMVTTVDVVNDQLAIEVGPALSVASDSASGTAIAKGNDIVVNSTRISGADIYKVS